MLTKESIEKVFAAGEDTKVFRERFGQFYASVNKETGEPRIVDIEGGVEVIAEEDGRRILVVASNDIERWLAAENQKKLTELLSLLELKD